MNNNNIIDFEKLEVGIGDQIGHNLYCVRTRQGIPQKKAANNLGISLSQWKKFEQGKEIMRLDTAVRWCTESGVPLSRLFSGTVYAENRIAATKEAALDRLSATISHLDNTLYLYVVNTLCTVFCIATKPITHTRAFPCHFSFDKKLLIDEYFSHISVGVREYRDKHKLSQSDVAEGVNISVSAYQNYECKSKFTRFSTILAARYAVYTKQNPLALVSQTRIGNVRKHHDERLRHFTSIVEEIDEVDYEFIEHLMKKTCQYFNTRRRN